MADTKISALSSATALGGTELIAGVQSGGNVSMTPAQINTYIAGTGRLFAKATGLWYILGQSGVAVSHTGDTSEFTLATVTVPAGAMGANGALRITTCWTITSSANNKTLRVRLGGIAGTLYKNVAYTTTAIDRHQCEIHNRNAANSQTGYNSGGAAGGWGSATTANQTGAIDTSSSQDVVITGTLANAGETITLESYIVELFYQV